MMNLKKWESVIIVTAQPKPNQAKPTQIQAGLDLVIPLFLFLRFYFLKIFFTPKLSIGPIQTSSNLIGPFQKSTKLELSTNLSKASSLNWNYWCSTALSYICNSPPKLKPISEFESESESDSESESESVT